MNLMINSKLLQLENTSHLIILLTSLMLFLFLQIAIIIIMTAMLIFTKNEFKKITLTLLWHFAWLFTNANVLHWKRHIITDWEKGKASKITFAYLFIALLRCRSSENIRILLPNKQNISCLNYLTAQKSQENVILISMRDLFQKVIGFTKNKQLFNTNLLNKIKV